MRSLPVSGRFQSAFRSSSICRVGNRACSALSAWAKSLRAVAHADRALEAILPTLQSAFSRCRSGLAPECTAHGLGLSCNDLKISLCCLIGIPAMLLPIAQRAERNAKGLGKFDLREAQTPANSLCQRYPPNRSNAARIAILDRQCIGVSPCRGQDLRVGFNPQSSPLLGCHPICMFIDPRLTRARSLRCSLFAHVALPFAPK
jgi:hypothetical protein